MGLEERAVGSEQRNANGGFTLETERLLLRDFRDEDFGIVHAYGTDMEVVRYMPWGPNTEADTREFLTGAQDGAKVEPRTDFDLAVVRKDTDQLIGGIGLHVHGFNAMLGYCFARGAWGSGYATEASRVLVDFGFRTQGVHRIWAGCDPENTASVRVLKKLGMSQEGHFRQDVRIRGEWRDTLVFAVLRDEWTDPDPSSPGEP